MQNCLEKPYDRTGSDLFNSMIKLADKVAIFEIKKTQKTKENDNKTKPMQKKKSAIWGCKPLPLAEN